MIADLSSGRLPAHTIAARPILHMQTAPEKRHLPASAEFLQKIGRKMRIRASGMIEMSDLERPPLFAQQV